MQWRGVYRRVDGALTLWKPFYDRFYSSKGGMAATHTIHIDYVCYR